MKIKDIIRLACVKRGLSPEDIEKVMATVHEDMRGFSDLLDKEVPEDEVQETVDDCVEFTEIMHKLDIPVRVAKLGIEKAKDEIRRNN